MALMAFTKHVPPALRSLSPKPAMYQHLAPSQKIPVHLSVCATWHQSAHLAWPTVSVCSPAPTIVTSDIPKSLYYISKSK